MMIPTAARPVAILGIALASVLATSPWALADHMPNTLRVTITDVPDPAGSETVIDYTIAVKNDGTQRSFNVRVETAVPVGATFVSCRTSISTVPCQRDGDLLWAVFPVIRAHEVRRVLLSVRAPLVAETTVIRLDVSATGDNAHKGDGSQGTTVFPPVTAATLLPSGRGAGIECGDTIDDDYMGADTTVLINEGLVCANAGYALRITASGMTLDLGGKKIVHTTPRRAGDVAILIGADTTNVTVRGGGTAGTKGIEQYDICVKDESGNSGLLITGLRCFRARSAGFDISSPGVTISLSLVDNTIPATGITSDPVDGGVGIRARGDNLLIKDTIVRRSDRVGIWAHGTDLDASGLAVRVDGNTTTSRVESNFAIGILLEGGPHLVKDTKVQGDGRFGASTDGVVVAATAVAAFLDGVVVKRHGGNGFVVEGTGTRIERGSAEELGGVGYLLRAATQMSGTTVQYVTGDAYRIEATAIDSFLDSNVAENTQGNGFVVHAPAILSNNTAKLLSAGVGYLVTANGVHLDTNEAERTRGGFRIVGNDNFVESGRSKLGTAIGLEIVGTGNRLNTCQAEDNAGFEFSIGPSNVDDGGNKANGDGFEFTAAGGNFE